MSAHPSITPGLDPSTSAPPATAPIGAAGPGSAWRGMALIAVAAVAWGTGGAAAAVLYRTSGLGPIAVSYWRFVIGALTLAIYLTARNAHRRATARNAHRRATARDVHRRVTARDGGRRVAARDEGRRGTAHDAHRATSRRPAAVAGHDRLASCDAISCDAISCDVISCDVISCDAIACGESALRDEAVGLPARSRRDSIGRVVRRLAVVVASGVGLAVYQSAFYASIADAGLAVGTVVTLGAGPILIAVGARVFLAERLGHAGAAAITLALSGLVALSLDSGATGPDPARGIVFALLSAFGYAVVTLIGRATTGGGDPFRTALSGFVVGGVVLMPFALAEGVLPEAAGLPVTAGWLLYLGVVTSALAYGLFFAGLALVSATTASIVTLLEPVAAALLAIAFLGEHLTPAVLTGMFLLLVAVAALTLPARR
jgi:DME family drug/metabolite transporter